MRGSVSSGFRAPTPGQQNGFNISSWFDPTIGDLVNNAVIPSISPAARLRGGLPLGPEQSVNYTAGVVFDSGSFTLTADWFHIDVSDRIGITSNFYLTDAEVADLVAGGFDAAESVRNFRFFTNAFATSSRGIDVVSTYTPLGLRGNTIISAAFNHTDTQVTDNARGLLDGRRLAEYAYALPRTRGNVGVTQRLGPASLLGRVSYYSGWYDYDSGYGEIFAPSGGLAQGFFAGRPIVDLEIGLPIGEGATLAVGGRNLFDVYSQVSAIAMSVGERYSEYTHAVGLQRRLLLRAHRLRLGKLNRSSEPGPARHPGRKNRPHRVAPGNPRRAGGHRLPEGRQFPDYRRNENTYSAFPVSGCTTSGLSSAGTRRGLPRPAPSTPRCTACRRRRR